MAKAAHLSGKAINITRTTAPHAISYPLTSYFGIAHGHAVALTLPAMLGYNFGANKQDTLDHRGYTYVQKNIEEVVALLGQHDVSRGKKAIEDLMDRIGLERRLSELGLQKGKDIQKIVERGFDPDRVRNNPRLLTRESLNRILVRIY